MTAQLIELPSNPVFDNGSVADGAVVIVYATGTTTPVTVYTTSALTTAAGLAQRTADADGVVAPLYFDNANTIRLVVTNSGGDTLHDIDPYIPGGGGTGGGGTGGGGTGGGGSEYLTVPDQADSPKSIYVGDSTIPNLAAGLGNNVLVGMDILSSSYTGTDAINPDTGYGNTLIGTGIGTQNMTNNRDNVIIGYEPGLYLGNCDQMVIIGAKALYGNTTRTETSNNHSPKSGVAIGLTVFFEGLTFTSSGFVAIGTNVGRDQTRSFETVQIGENSGRYLTQTLYNVFIGADTGGGATDSGATNTTNNVALGWTTLGALKNGTQNIVLGGNAGRGVTDGGRNVLVGHGAGSDLPSANGAAGANALTTGSNNTLIGNETEVSGPTATYQVAIGSGAVATANNQMMFGDTGRDHQYAFTNGYTKGKVYTVATLPNAATAGAGSRAFVSDTTLTVASSFATSTTGTGGGANFAPVYSDGSAWRIG